MAEIDPQNGFRFDFSKIEIVPLEEADPGVNHQWIERTTYADRARALELLRWQSFGQNRTQSDIRRVIEVVETCGTDFLYSRGNENGSA